MISMKCLASQEGHLEEELTFINDACLAAVSSQQWRNLMRLDARKGHLRNQVYNKIIPTFFPGSTALLKALHLLIFVIFFWPYGYFQVYSCSPTFIPGPMFIPCPTYIPESSVRNQAQRRCYLWCHMQVSHCYFTILNHKRIVPF